MKKIILADSQPIFRAGTVKVLATDEDIQIVAQCSDIDRMYHAIATFPGSVVVFASSLRPDLVRLRMLLEVTCSLGIVIAENNESTGTYLREDIRGIVFRSVTGPALVECVRRVTAGETWLPPQMARPQSQEEELAGARIRNRLPPKDVSNVILIVYGGISGNA